MSVRTALRVALVLPVLLWSTAVIGQDADPGNDTSAGALDSGLTAGSVVFIDGRLVSGTDVDYYAVTMQGREVLIASTLPVGGTFDVPDTEIYLLDTDGSTVLVSDDDDGAHEAPGSGEQYGSTLRYRAPTSGTYYLVVTGCCSFGEHGEVGSYRLLAAMVNEIATPSGDTDPANDTDAGADDLGILAPGAAFRVGELASFGARGASGDVDYYAVELSVGDQLVAATAPLDGLPSDFDDPNTELGVYDPNGFFAVLDDDSGTDQPSGSELGSVVRFRAQQDGVHYVVVSGDPDENSRGLDDLDGDHTEVGRYLLAVGVQSDISVLEVPTMGMIGLTALVALLGLCGVLISRRF